MAARELAPALPERTQLGEPAGDLFGSHTWQPPPRQVAGPPPRPVPPPMPYRFAGRLVQDGQVQIFLSKGDRPVPIKQGEVLDGTYRVDAVAESGVTLTYLPLGFKEIIPVGSALGAGTAAAPPAGLFPTAAGVKPEAAPNPFAAALARAFKPALPHGDVARAPAETGAETRLARLQWEGPPEVKLGASFSVALRVVSDEPVRTSPMQVRFDPLVLESVAVKPGKIYGADAGRSFRYRINADGLIFVAGVAPEGSSATAGELLVLTFKPIKSGAIADVSVASLSLQGAGGRVIAHDALAAFRTTVIP